MTRDLAKLTSPSHRFALVAAINCSLETSYCVKWSFPPVASWIGLVRIGCIQYQKLGYPSITSKVQNYQLYCPMNPDVELHEVRYVSTRAAWLRQQLSTVNARLEEKHGELAALV